MADELTPLRAVAFEVSAYPKQPAFAVDKEVCRTLGIEGSGDGE
jgi:hypothetical protein